ncbi:hypothetical protein Tco_0022266 [Tanacetum coccineum]
MKDNLSSCSDSDEQQKQQLHKNAMSVLNVSKNKGLVAETFDWDEEKVYDDEEMVQVKELMAFADDELVVGKNHARNGELIDITIRKVNILLSTDEDAD